MHPVTIQDVQSNTWLKLKAYYQARLQVLREQNDGEMFPDVRQKHLGRIAEVKAFLALEQAVSPQPLRSVE